MGLGVFEGSYSITNPLIVLGYGRPTKTTSLEVNTPFVPTKKN
jgi:hypothetical protein